MFWSRSRRWLALLLLVAAPTLAATPSSSRDELPPVRIGVLALRGVEVARRMWTPTLRYLEARIPERRFELLPLTYEELFPAFENGRVDFGLTAAGQYIELELRYGATRIATVLNSGPNGDFAEYGGVFVARADRNDILEPRDLRGRTLLVPNRLSFGGWQMQWRELRELGLEPERDFRVIEAGDNEKSILQVLDGVADVGAARTDVIERLARDGRLDPKRLRVLIAPAAPQSYPYAVSTRLYPEWPLAMARETPDELARRVVVALLQMPRDSEAARAAEIVGWTVPGDYQTVHDLFRELEIGPYRPREASLHDVVHRHWERVLLAVLVFCAVLFAAVLRIVSTRRSLVEEKARSETYLELIGTMIVVIDNGGRIVRVNRRTVEVLGWAEAELVGQNLFDRVIPPESRGEIREVFAQLMGGGVDPVATHENEVLTAGGGRRLIRWNNRVSFDPQGRPNAVISAGEDITEQRRAERQLQLLARAFENSVEGLVICDPAAAIVSVNPAFTQITGYAAEEVLGRNPRLLASGRHDAAFHAQMWQALASEGQWRGEVWNRRKDGAIYPEWLSISVLRDPQGRIANYVGVFSDISRQKADQERIHFLAYYDPLTHLPNRTLLADRFELALARAQRDDRHLAVLFIDLDRFKQVNDSLGHQVGDQLLQAVAQRFRDCLRESDTLARLGGDEFILLLPDLADSEDAALVAEKCVDALRIPSIIAGHELHVSPSIGIAVHPQDGESLDSLVKNADTAMYAAKDAGRNTYRFFAGAMNDNLYARLLLENELRLALERGEFVLHYQPQVDIRSGGVVGIEALVRWQHPQRGIVPPGEFISAAEDAGLIVGLGDWVLREACRQNAAWQAAGLPPMPVAVNVSAPQFRMRDFYAGVTAALSLAGLDGHWLELELTESILIEDADQVLCLLEDLKALGLSLSVDDFGTGYSSLAYLKRFPVDKLKVDRSFVRDLTVDDDDLAIATSIIAMGHRLGLRVLAEGVETADQLAILGGEGCDEYQGYLFGPPMGADEVAALLRRIAADGARA